MLQLLFLESDNCNIFEKLIQNFSWSELAKFNFLTVNLTFFNSKFNFLTENLIFLTVNLTF
jgi:hypothetical protein